MEENLIDYLAKKYHINNKDYDKKKQSIKEKHYVRYYLANSFFQETIEKEIESGQLNTLNFLSGTFCIDLYTKVKNENGKEEIIDEQKYYIGKALTIEEVISIYGKNSSAYRNIINLATCEEIAFLGAAANLQIIKKGEHIIHPYKLKKYPQQALTKFYKLINKLEEVETK